MKHQKQLYSHKPEMQVYGDCARTVYSALLDMNAEDVPHFVWDNPDAQVFAERQRMFLESVGYREVSFPFRADLQSLQDHMRLNSPGIYYMLVGESRTGCNHAVVCLNGEIVMDPAINDSGIIGPSSDGFYWLSFLVPASQTDGTKLLPHDLYKTGDENIPRCIQDCNDEVVLELCKVCGLGEVELLDHPVCAGSKQ